MWLFLSSLLSLSLSTCLKCNSDVSADFLSIILYVLSLSLLSLFLLFSLLLLYWGRHCKGRIKDDTHSQSCSLWSACHFCSSVVTVVSRTEHLASSQWSNSNGTVTLAVNLCVSHSVKLQSSYSTAEWNHAVIPAISKIYTIITATSLAPCNSWLSKKYSRFISQCYCIMPFWKVWWLSYTFHRQS